MSERHPGKWFDGNGKVFAGLLLLSFVLRLPFFFPPVINWDESSSILMGNSIATGHLPYTELWNVKPPLLYYFFSLFLLAFGNSIEAVRLGGTLCVAFVAMCVHVSARRVWDGGIALLAAVISIFLMSTLGGSQSTMSEHLALVPLMASLLVLQRERIGVGHAILAGALLSAAGMIRLNLAYVAVGVVAFVLLWPTVDGFKARLLRATAMSVSGLLVIFATLVPHLFHGSAPLWMSAVVQAPLSYSAAQHGMLVASLMLLAYFSLAGWGMGLTVLVANVVGLWRRVKRGRILDARVETLLGIYAGTTLLSILLSGGAFQHYLLQIVPFAAMFAAAVLLPAYRNLPTPRRRTVWRAVAGLLVLSASLPSLLQYGKLASQVAKGGLRGAPEYAIADYLRERLGPRDGLYMMGDHVVYWFLGRLPVDQAVTHPSNIAKPYLLKHMPGTSPTVEGAMADLFAKAPRYVVKPRDLSYLSASPDALALIKLTLERHYVLEKTLAGREIYRLDESRFAASDIRKVGLALVAETSASAGKRPEKSAAKDKEKKAVPVQAQTVVRGESRSYLSGLGTASAASSVVVRTRVDGHLIKLHGREGDTVAKGQLLAEIDPRPLQMQLAQAEAKLARDQVQLQNADGDLERYRSLLDKQFISAQKLESQQALVRQFAAVIALDQAEVDNAKLQLSYARITAPAAGQLGLRLVDEGNVVRSSDTNGIVVINRMDPLNVVFTVPEGQLSRILPQWRAGKPLAVEAWDREQKRMLKVGRLVSMDNQVDLATGTVRAKAEFDNKDLALFPNQFVNVRVLLGSRADAVQAPAGAIQHGRDGAFVYVVKEDRTVTRRAVEVGSGDARQIEVLSGLAPGEQVVTDGVDRLREGTRVEVVDPRSLLRDSAASVKKDANGPL